MHGFLPVIEVQFLADDFIKFGGVPVADQQQILVGVFEIEHNFQAVLHDAPDATSGGAWAQSAARVAAELLGDVAQAVFHALIEHAIAQQLVIANLEQFDVRLKIAVRCDDDGAIPVHDGQVILRVAHARDQDVLDLGLVQGFTLCANEVRQPPGVTFYKRIRSANCADHQDDIFLEQATFEIFGRDQLPQQVIFDALPFLDGGLSEHIGQWKFALNDLDAVIVTLPGDSHRLASCLGLNLPQRPDGDVHRLEIGRVFQPANLLRRLG